VTDHPDVVILLTDEERAAPPYEDPAVARWRRETLAAERWFAEHGVTFARHQTGSLACVPSRPTLFTGQYPDLHGVTQTDGLGKAFDDSRMRWLPADEVPTLGHWFRAGGYDTHYQGKWHISHADLLDPATGKALATNTDEGEVLSQGVDAYAEADPLDAHGFSGWIGPEPHGAGLANSGLRRDPLTAERVLAWLTDRYARRAAGDLDAQRPFLLVASFVNPHDIVLFPVWARTKPLAPGPLDPPPVPEAPTEHEDLATKPAAQAAYRAAYPSGYGPPAAIGRVYDRNAQAYRDLYHRLHAEVDGPLDRVRQAVVDSGADTVLVRTADHGELLGAHGGLHQKWFNLYDEATRVPFTIARVGSRPTTARTIDAPTSHVDLVPTLLGAAGIDAAAVAVELASSFSEVHPLPGADLMPVVDGADPDEDRAVYLMTRDNMLEGDTGASGLARRLGRTAHPPAPLRIQVPAHVAANFEAIVTRIDGHLWKLVRTFDDPATWTEPDVRHLAADGLGGPTYRTEPVPDQWELYDQDADPLEAVNRVDDPGAADVLGQLRHRLKEVRAASVPERNEPWPYAHRGHGGRPAPVTPPAPARLLRKAFRRLGMHPDDLAATTFDLPGKRALVIATNHGVLDVGKPTGVFASELTVPYYVFLDAGLGVDVASPLGGVIPVDPMSLKPVVRCEADDRFLGDPTLRGKVTDSLPIATLDITAYDIVFLAGGWGAAFDFGVSDDLADQVTAAAAAGAVLGGICHGPLGLVNARAADGRPLVEGRRVTGVTDKQVQELGISSTPFHPETELRRAGARFESATRFRDPLANHWVVDDRLVTGQNQNAGPMVAREMLRIVASD
jgi:arylsulfatase A-like enzyme/putative intracellular protease/amidase